MMVSKVWKNLIGVLVFILCIAALGGCGDSSDKKSNETASLQTNEAAKQKNYAEADINILISEAKENAAAAGKNYKNKDIKIVGGIVKNIDSDLKYFTLDGTNDNFTMIGVTCQINKQNKDLQDAVLNIKKEQPVTVYGQITEVGDIMGYTLKLDKIEVNQ